MHEFVLSGAPMKKELGIKTLDLAKRLLDFGFHPPTVYFPLLVDEALLIEPTETETKETLDAFADAIAEILREAKDDPEIGAQRALRHAGAPPRRGRRGQAPGHPPARRVIRAVPVAVVDAERRHLGAVQAIYAWEIEHSAITFDLEDLGLAGWEQALAGLDASLGHAFLVAEDEDGTVLGYAKTGRWRDKGAYATTAETSVYVDRDARGRGVGSLLYTELIARAERSPLRRLVGGMTEPNDASRALHLAHGFELVGTFDGVGVKFGQAWDVTWFQRAV